MTIEYRKIQLEHIMKYILVPTLFTFTVLNFLTAQTANFDEKQFFKSVKESYYTLADKDINNFTALITSLKMEKFAEDNWENTEIFPLQLIWFKPDRLYLSQQGVPTIKDNRYQEFQEIVDGLKQQMRGILVDLQRFYIIGLFESIPDSYKIQNDERFVWISYNAGTPEQEVPVLFTMGLNGLCLKIEIAYPEENKKIFIYPSFRTIKTKWLCEGWSVQTVVNDEVVSGFVLDFNHGEVANIWVPIQINIAVQRADDPGNTYYDVIKLRNYLYNQSIELIERTN